jgi:hypothetical protein
MFLLKLSHSETILSFPYTSTTLSTTPALREWPLHTPQYNGRMLSFIYSAEALYKSAYTSLFHLPWHENKKCG